MSFPEKRPSEHVVLTFDMSPMLSTGETIASITSIASTRVYGESDASPLILSGTAQVGAADGQPGSTAVLQAVTDGTDGTDYRVDVIYVTSTGRTLEESARLPVRAARV